MHCGLVVVSASRSRPYQRATEGGSGRQTATCLLVSPVFVAWAPWRPTSWLSQSAPWDRHPDGPRPPLRARVRKPR